MAVRERAGLFDLSNLGEVELAGADALAALQRMTCADAARLGVGEVQYSGLTTPAGTFVDDLLVCRLGSQHFLLVVNAGNVGKDVAWILEQARAFGDVAVVDTSSRYALLAPPGPARARDAPGGDGRGPRGNRVPPVHARGGGRAPGAMISRTGYTGECGYEVLTPPAAAAKVWEAVLREGSDSGVVPAGLGARDTLRLEAGIRLYGNDIDDTTSVLEADLEWIVGWEKGDFNGRAALAEQKARGALAAGSWASRRWTAPSRSAATPRTSTGARVGTVTSGALAPFLAKGDRHDVPAGGPH